MKKPVIFTIGSATFDLFMRPQNQEVIRLSTPEKREELFCLKYGAKVRVDEIHETFGGGATNTAVAFARQGMDAYPVVCIGREYGQPVMDNLRGNKVNTNFVHQNTAEKTSFSVILNIFDGDRTVLAYPGANQLLTEKMIPWKDMEKADWIFLGHLAQKDNAIPKALLKFLKKHPRIKLAWNPGHEQFLLGTRKWAELLKRTEVLFLNKEEASQFSGKPYEMASQKGKPVCKLHAKKGFLPPYADDVTEIMMEFFKYGPRHVVITDGRNGAQASDGKYLYFCPVETTKRVDTLGAGDAFASGFTGALILGKSLKESLIYGTLNATSVVSYYGAQQGLLTSAQLAARQKATELCVTRTLI